MIANTRLFVLWELLLFPEKFHKWWYIQVFTHKLFNIISNATIYNYAFNISFHIRAITFSKSLGFFRSSCKGSNSFLGWVLDSGALTMAGASILACDFFTGLIVLHSLQMLLKHKNHAWYYVCIIKCSNYLLLSYFEVVNLDLFHKEQNAE